MSNSWTLIHSFIAPSHPDIAHGSIKPTTVKKRDMIHAQYLIMDQNVYQRITEKSSLMLTSDFRCSTSS